MVTSELPGRPVSGSILLKEKSALILYGACCRTGQLGTMLLILDPVEEVLSTCPLHTNSGCTNNGCGKREAHINWSMVTCQGSTRLELTTLGFTGPVPVESQQ